MKPDDMRASINDVSNLRRFAYWASNGAQIGLPIMASAGGAIERLLEDYDAMRLECFPRLENYAEVKDELKAKRRERTKANTKARNKRRREAELGRVCVGCKRTDSETNWSNTRALCGACICLRRKYGSCRCGSPIWQSPGYKECRAGCAIPPALNLGTGAYHPTPGHIPHSPATPSAEPPEATGQHSATMPRVVSPTVGEAETA